MARGPYGHRIGPWAAYMSTGSRATHDWLPGHVNTNYHIGSRATRTSDWLVGHLYVGLARGPQECRIGSWATYTSDWLAGHLYVGLARGPPMRRIGSRAKYSSGGVAGRLAQGPRQHRIGSRQHRIGSRATYIESALWLRITVSCPLGRQPARWPKISICRFLHAPYTGATTPSPLPCSSSLPFRLFIYFFFSHPGLWQCFYRRVTAGSPVLDSGGTLIAGTVDGVGTAAPAWASVGVTKLGGPWRCSSSRTVCLTEFKKAVIISELAVDSLASLLELPGTLGPVPVGASVGVISGTVVALDVSLLSMVTKDEYLPLTCFERSRSPLLYCTCDPFLSCSCTAPATLSFRAAVLCLRPLLFALPSLIWVLPRLTLFNYH